MKLYLVIVDIITLDPHKRGGKPTIRGMRITVYDALSMLASGMSHQQILSDFPELTQADVYASLAYASDRERVTHTIAYEATPRSKPTLV